MVRRLLFALLVSAPLVLSACSMRKWWGEEPVKPGVVEMPSSQSDCHPIMRVLDGSEEESSATFDCWAKTLDGLWAKVVGTRKNVLSNEEIDVLLRKGILTFGGEVRNDKRKLGAIRRLLGLRDSLRREELNSWIALFKAERADLRELYLTYQSVRQNQDRLTYADVALAANTLSPVLRKMNWSMDSGELTDTLLQLVEVQDEQVRKIILPTARLSISFLNMICPTFTKKEVWNTAELGACASDLMIHFSPGAPWFEFVLNPGDSVVPIGPPQLELARESLNQLMPLVENWFDRPQLSSFPTERVLDLSRALGMEPPENLVESLNIVSRFNEKSDGRLFHPTLVTRLFGIFRDFQLDLLESIGPFVKAARRGTCVNREARDWVSCILPGNLSARDRLVQIDRALRIKNPHYGMQAVPFNGNRFAWILFYNTVAGEMINLFAETDEHGNKETVVRSDPGKDQDDVVQMITTGVEAYDTLQGFIVNLRRKIHGQSFVDRTTMQKLRRIQPRALARLATLTSDLLVQRNTEERNAFARALSLVTNLAPESSLYLDQMALTAVLNLVDSLGAYKSIFSEHNRLIDSKSRSEVLSGTAPGNKMDDAVDYLMLREDFRKTLPEMLKENFPRTYASCLEFGFEISCGLALDQVLPEVQDRPGYVHFGDIDAVTLMAAAMEGLFDACDRDGDGKLSWAILDGDDELDCGYVRVKDAIKRLMDAGMISTNEVESVGIKFLLNFINANFVTRAMGKAALMRGTQSNMLINWPLFWMNKRASIGSVYGLVADVMDHDQVRNLKKARKKRR